jgi:hypothetical protein
LAIGDPSAVNSPRDRCAERYSKEGWGVKAPKEHPVKFRDADWRSLALVSQIFEKLRRSWSKPGVVIVQESINLRAYASMNCPGFKLGGQLGPTQSMPDPLEVPTRKSLENP